MRGEPGIGKTALLEHAVESASDMRVLRAAGLESEVELAFAGLHQLCAPMLDRLDRLPAPQREALEVAFGLSAGEAPGRFLVGLATLSLLSDAAEDKPLVCAIDDAQWLDEESALTLAFVAHRIHVDSVALVFATRDFSDGFGRGLPELVLHGLEAEDARSLLATGIVGVVDEQIRDRVVAETRGNPLALLELPRGLSAAELAGGFGAPGDRPITDRIEQSFLRRLESMPARTQQLLLIAAAEPIGDVALLWRAANPLELGPDAADPAQTAGLIDFGTRVRFRHPLVRSAIYQAASRPGSACRSPCAGGGNRSGDGSGPAYMAPCPGSRWARRGGRRPARARRRPGAGSRRCHRGSCVSRARDRADSGSGPARDSGAGSRPGQVPVGGSGGRGGASGDRRDVPAGRPAEGPCGASAC